MDLLKVMDNHMDINHRDINHKDTNHLKDMEINLQSLKKLFKDLEVWEEEVEVEVIVIPE